MRLLGVLTLLAAGCSGHGHGSDAASNVCRPFSVTARGDQSEVQPVWAGDSWAIARPGVYVAIDGGGTVTDTPLPELPMESFAWDGVELGYYVATPLPHLMLFSAGDVTTLHSSPSFPTTLAVSATASVRADPTGAARIEAFFTQGNVDAIFGWSDGSYMHEFSDRGSVALALAPDGTGDVHGEWPAGPGTPNPPWEILANGVPLATAQAPQPPFPAGGQMVASNNVAIVRHVLGDWKVANGAATPIDMPPLAWNGEAFVSADAGALVLHDRDFQPAQAPAVTVPDAPLLGVGATRQRALLVFASASTEVTYVQVCL